MKISTISSRPFMDTLARELINRSQDNPLSLSDFTILLPNRRAARSLREVLLRISGGKPLLLPKMLPLAEANEGELLMLGEELIDIPPAINPLRRRFLLARLVMKRYPDIMPQGAISLAASLEQMLNDCALREIDLSKIEHLAPEEFASHWQQTLEFLTIITKMWQPILDEEGAIDAIDRKNRFLRAKAKRWQQNPPPNPIIAAGISSPFPAVCELISVIGNLLQGEVVLSDLDLSLDDETWHEVDASHPQGELKQFLKMLKIKREEVKNFGGDFAPLPRGELLSLAMLPAASTDKWQEAGKPEGLAGVTLIEAEQPHEEALTIALILRNALEKPEARAALITPDRNLSRRVAAELNRWGLMVDDSAGRPLALTPCGTFLLLAASLAEDETAPVALLSLLKHPLSAAGFSEGEFRKLTRELELNYLRGVRKAGGLKTIVNELEDGALKTWLFKLLEIADPLFELGQDGKRKPLKAWLNAHFVFAEKLAANGDLVGELRLWRGEDGDAAAKLAADIMQEAEALPEVDVEGYIGLIQSLFYEVMVRPRFGTHPRLDILGLMEARLQNYDVVVIAGLNDGTFPPAPAIDPWLSRPMRKKLGLDDGSGKIGIAAHDFCEFFNNPEVYLTRSRKVDGSPTVPARWLLRLQAVAGDYEAAQKRGEYWLNLALNLDKPESFSPFEMPAPTPPVFARPTKLAVTAIEKLMRDPYSVYARYILKLYELDPLDADPSVADYGSLVHAALEDFLKLNRAERSYEKLLELGREKLLGEDISPAVKSFWWNRFEKIAAWIIKQEAAANNVTHNWAEITGAYEITGSNFAFTLTAKADRIDLLGDGSLRIIDYKTGNPPKEKEILAGFSPQLPLEGVIAAAGGFKEIGAKDVSQLVFWQINGRGEGGEEHQVKEPLEAIAKAKEGLVNLIAKFMEETTPYLAVPHSKHAPTYNPYQHLARVKEWASEEEE